MFILGYFVYIFSKNAFTIGTGFPLLGKYSEYKSSSLLLKTTALTVVEPASIPIYASPLYLDISQYFTQFFSCLLIKSLYSCSSLNRGGLYAKFPEPL